MAGRAATECGASSSPDFWSKANDRLRGAGLTAQSPQATIENPDRNWSGLQQLAAQVWHSVSVHLDGLAERPILVAVIVTSGNVALWEPSS